MQGKRLSKEEVEQCKNNYIEGSSITEISKKLGVTSASICYHLDKFPEIKRTTHLKSNKKYSLDEFYFKDIDSERKAYYLGLLYADGYNNTKQHFVKIALQERDGYILEELKRDLKFTGPIKFVKKRKENHQNLLKLSISCKRMSSFLESKGMIQNKSLVVKFPQWLDNNLVSHFIRGVFDGDGCIAKYIKGKRYPSVGFTIVGTYDTCFNIGEIFKRELGIGYYINKKVNVFILAIGGRLQLSKIYKYLYKDSTVFLTRKKDRFEEWENYERVPQPKGTKAQKEAGLLRASKYKKPVIKFDLDGNLLQEYPGLIDAARDNNLLTMRTAIQKCCKRKYGYRHVKGFIWRYKEDSTY